MGGLEPAPRQRMYFANHSSHLDAVVLWAALPAAARALTSPVAGRDYWGRTAHSPVPRGRTSFRRCSSTGSRKASERSLAAAEAVIDAAGGRARSPAGRSSCFRKARAGRGDEVAPFKSGIYHLARQRPDVELVPAYLENLNRILPKGEVLPVPLLSSATFGPPMRIEPGEDKAAFLERARDAVVD